MECLYMDDAVLILQCTFGKDELAACNHQPLPLIEVGRDDDIGDASFVFHRQKNKSHSRTGPLTSDDAASRPNENAVLAVL